MEKHRDVMKHRTKEHYVDPKNMDTQIYVLQNRMKEHCADPKIGKNREM